MEETLYGFLEINIDGRWVSADSFASTETIEYLFINKNERVNHLLLTGEYPSKAGHLHLTIMKLLPINMSKTTHREIEKISPPEGTYDASWLIVNDLLKCDYRSNGVLVRLVASIKRRAKEMFKIDLDEDKDARKNFRVIFLLCKEEVRKALVLDSDLIYTSSSSWSDKILPTTAWVKIDDSPPPSCAFTWEKDTISTISPTPSPPITWKKDTINTISTRSPNIYDCTSSVSGNFK